MIIDRFTVKRKFSRFGIPIYGFVYNFWTLLSDTKKYIHIAFLACKQSLNVSISEKLKKIYKCEI